MATRRLIALLVLGLILGHGQTVMASTAKVGALSELRVNEEVDGDVVAIGGDVVLGPEARVHGHAVSIFGSVRVEPGAQVDGRVIGLSSLASLSLASVEEGGGLHRLDTGLRFVTAGGWLFVTTLIAFLWPAPIRRGVAALPQLGAKTLVLGVMVAITLLAGLIAVIGLGPFLGLPLAAALAVAFLVVKALGLAVLGGGVGTAILRRVVPSRIMPITTEVFVGVVVMLMVRFLPVVGGMAWTVLVLVALGTGVFVATLAQHPNPAALRSGSRFS